MHVLCAALELCCFARLSSRSAARHDALHCVHSMSCVALCDAAPEPQCKTKFHDIVSDVCGEECRYSILLQVCCNCFWVLWLSLQRANNG